jgi:hypothetical protein
VTACATKRFNQEEPASNREERIVRRPCGRHAQGCVSLDRCDITDGQMRKGSRISGIGQNLYFSGPLCVLQGLGRPGYGQIERSLADGDPAGEGERRDRRPVTDNVSTERAYHRLRFVVFPAPEQSSRKRACGSYAPVLITRRLGRRNGCPKNRLGIFHPGELDRNQASLNRDVDQSRTVPGRAQAVRGSVEDGLRLAQPAPTHKQTS